MRGKMAPDSDLSAKRPHSEVLPPHVHLHMVIMVHLIDWAGRTASPGIHLGYTDVN